MSDIHQFFAPTSKGLEALLADELTSLGLSKVTPVRAGVSFEGPLEAAYRACLWSRVANRVLLPLRKFAAPSPEKLYGGVKQIRWSDHLTSSNTIAVDFSASSSEITHSHFGALKVKDAIVDQMRSIHGSRPSVETGQPDVRINVYLHQNEATVSLDLSGDSLHRRGYRDEAVEAPMKENLAASILLLADWPQVAAQGGALIDPMCGSGTIPIEAALIATRTAPGLNRKYYGFLGWSGHQPQVWARLLQEAQELIIREKKKIPPIVGYDHDFKAVRLALANVERAGMHGKIHIEKREFNTLEPIESFGSAPTGIVVINPPYGERLGEVEDLKPLYKEMGDTFKKKFGGWNGFVFTGSSELAKMIRLKTSRRFPLYNGAIDCRLLKYEMYAGSLVAKEPQEPQNPETSETTDTDSVAETAAE